MGIIRTHSKLRMTPAMQAGIASTFLSFEDVIARIDAAQVPAKRGPYKKRAKAYSLAAGAALQLSPSFERQIRRSGSLMDI